jgi:type IV pilus assembly protein PilV
MRGVSIVESLVALVVISVGMLGIAGLYLSSLQAGRSAKMRSQAVNLASSMADRIRANRQAARTDYLTATYGGAPATQNCLAATCSPAALAQDDLARWIADIRADLPGVPATTTGTVTFTAGAAPNPADTFLITVTWREANSDIDFSYSLPLSLSRNL